MRIGLFIPCHIDAFFPNVGIATSQLLGRLGMEVVIHRFGRHVFPYAPEGPEVHSARDASEHNQIIYDKLSAHRAKTLVKSKSMLTEECDVRAFLETRGVKVIETDFGGRIQQLDDGPLIT